MYICVDVDLINAKKYQDILRIHDHVTSPNGLSSVGLRPVKQIATEVFMLTYS